MKKILIFVMVFGSLSVDPNNIYPSPLWFKILATSSLLGSIVYSGKVMFLGIERARRYNFNISKKN